MLLLLWHKFLTELFLQIFYFLFLEILNSKQMVQVSLFSFYLRILRKSKYNFLRNSSVKTFCEMMITAGLLFAFYRKWYVSGFLDNCSQFFCFSTSSTFFCQNFHLTASHHGAQTWKTYVFTLSFTLCSIPPNTAQWSEGIS